ncbi:type II toxin-antitoxin system HicB family antitoxin [Fischerella thermalis]|uniref:type II toxin-antitoxin system HicB family antitoxin n=1 Tax=Fischerella thermalis TaxID=372787 RepID=UPI0015E11CC1|nr:type II toxin-antitoxin system HicB family antitoxin [Fischerella thermalis]
MNKERLLIKKEEYTYPAIFEYDDDGINVYFPDLEGCFTCADTVEEARIYAEDVMGLHLYYEEREGNLIPNPTPVDHIHLNRRKSS